MGRVLSAGLITLLALVGFSFSALAQDFEALKSLAEQGDAEAQAQFNLGVMYDNGRGIPENDAEAVKWYRKAAEQGHASAQGNLGVMYANGDGVPENYIKAYQWYSLAAAQGNSIAQSNKPKLAKRMTPAQIAEAQRLSTECYTANYKGCE